MTDVVFSFNIVAVVVVIVVIDDDGFADCRRIRRIRRIRLGSHQSEATPQESPDFTKSPDYTKSPINLNVSESSRGPREKSHSHKN